MELEQSAHGLNKEFGLKLALKLGMKHQKKAKGCIGQNTGSITMKKMRTIVQILKVFWFVYTPL